jgi:hypothetical protein
MADTKKVSGRTHNRGDFLVVEDPDKVTTWHLPVKVQGKADRNLAAAAWAALFSPGGFRGNKYQGPNKEEAQRKLRALYRSEGWEMPDTQEAHVTQLEGLTPLVERAVRRDGTIAIKMIEPGWGASGYYDKSVLERDVPKAFPRGTQMFWNHDTAEEAAARPEGDLSRLAAVTVTDPIFEEQGIDGPGMYARAKVFGPFQDTINEIAEHIGTSIRGAGITEQGEADGKSGPIVKEITKGKSVDFVTVPGAGGKIVEIFEAAGRGKQEDPEQGKLSFSEGLSNNDMQELLRKRLGDRFGGIDIDVWPRDWSIDDGWVVYELSTPSGRTTFRLGMAVTENDVMLAGGDPTEVKVKTEYIPVGNETSESAGDNPPEHLSEADMAEIQELKESLATAQKTISEQGEELARLRERELLRDARDFVADRLAEAELPDLTKTRLVRSLASNPPLKDGQIDEDAYGERIDEAVKEAQAEVASVLGQRGQIFGHGGGPGDGEGTGDDPPKLEEARKRQEAAFSSMGYGVPRNGTQGGSD